MSEQAEQVGRATYELGVALERLLAAIRSFCAALEVDRVCECDLRVRGPHEKLEKADSLIREWVAAEKNGDNDPARYGRAERALFSYVEEKES